MLEKPGYEPPSKEIREAEEAMEPWQAARTNARWKIMSHAQDLQAAGVAQEQIEKAAAIAEERAQSEFEQKEKSDPYRRVANTLENAAETPAEHAIASEMISHLEEHRTRLINEVRRADAIDKTGEDLGKVLARTGVARQDAISGEYLTNGEISAARGKSAPTAFVERVLRGLDGFEKTETLNSLKSLPEADYESKKRKPYYDSFFNTARNLPTIIDSVTLDVGLAEDSHRIWIKMNMDRVKQVINFPES